MKYFVEYPPVDLGAKWDITNYFLKYYYLLLEFSVIIYEEVLKKIFSHAPFSQCGVWP
jgi:hypothetical protein